MNQLDNRNLQTLNEVWRAGALEDFIRRMLVYFDPMGLMIMGAPHDEYDADVFKIMKSVLQEDVTLEQLTDVIFNLYNSNDINISDLKKKSMRMAEDLIGLKNS